MVCPMVSCPVCGLRVTPNRLVRLPQVDIFPLVGIKGAGRGRGWSVTFRIHDWERVVYLIGPDLLFFWALRMLSVLKEWLDAGLISPELVYSLLGLERVVVRIPSWLSPEREALTLHKKGKQVALVGDKTWKGL